MYHNLLKTCAAVFSACVLAVGCDGPTRPAPQLPPLIAEQALATLAGVYTLTVNLSDQCSALPDALRRRTYQAIIEATPYRYLGITTFGGGSSQPTGGGELWPSSDGRVAMEWNMFGEPCDGYPEPLPDGRQLMICGVGTGVVDGSTISLMLNAEIFIEGQRVCHGQHQFTFTRSPE